MFPNFLPFRGSVLLFGAPSSYQHFVGAQLVSNARDAGRTLHLTDADFRDPGALYARLRRVRPAFLYWDRSLQVQPLTADGWPLAAQEIVREIGSLVLTAAHIPHGPLDPRLAEFFDEAWQCAARHSKKHETDCAVTLQRAKPASADRILLVARGPTPIFEIEDGDDNG